MKSRHKFKRNIILVLGLILGTSLIFYPLLSQIYYDKAVGSELDEFYRLIESEEFIERKDNNVRLSQAYNEALEPNLDWHDPYGDDVREEGIQTYADMLKVKEKIGVVEIPKISQSLPIYVGTSEEVLQKGVGHLQGTSLPIGGINTHSVITAHRGLPNARLFTDLDKLDYGDVFSIETVVGKIYYEVDNIEIVEPTETDTIRIEEGRDNVTLLTCTPYMINSHRLLVRGHRIEEPPEIFKDTSKDFLYYISTYWYYLLIILVSLILLYVINNKYKNTILK